jgi:hypothetical protein
MYLSKAEPYKYPYQCGEKSPENSLKDTIQPKKGVKRNKTLSLEDFVIFSKTAKKSPENIMHAHRQTEGKLKVTFGKTRRRLK